MGDIPPTQRSPSSGIVAELSAEGFDDAEEIGRGGFGVVYRCTQPDLDRVVAVKILTAELDPDGLQRFVREQQAMGRLSGHPHIVAVFQVGTTRGGHPYLVMPYHAHGSLEQRIRDDGPLGWAAVLRLGVKISGALETAHRAGILHRDVKPGNILLTEYGEPELTDFGIARIPGGFRTTSGIITASPAFTAPEVLRGSPPTPVSDVYSLGATLFCSLTGHVAYERRVGEQVMAQFFRVSEQPVPDLGERDVPEEVRAAIEHAMATEPADRPAGAASLGQELRRVQERTGGPVDSLVLPPTHRPSVAPAEVSSSRRERDAVPPTPATKYRPPGLPRTPLPRKWLLDQLRSNEHTRLTWIHAPSGFGKTTLAAQWRDELLRKGAAVAWLTVDEDDNNVDWFLAHVVEALRSAYPRLADELADVLDAHPDPTRAMLTALVDALHTRQDRLTLVLDDWQRVNAPASVAAVRFLLEHGCHDLPIMVTSTSRSGLPLSRLRMHGDLVEIDATALRFDSDEVREFLAEAGGLRLNRADIDTLARVTDGWIAALQLAVLSLRAGEDPARLLERLAEHPDIGEFLAENVLGALDPGTLEFLMLTSLCERVCGDLAATLTGNDHAQELLEDIEDRGMFLQRADPERRWFRYHQLFAGYLRRRLVSERPDEIPALRLRASTWFAEHHLLNEAVDQALAAGDEDRAADLVEQDGQYLLERSRISLLQGILAKLPVRASRTRPRLQLLATWVNLVLRRPGPTAAALARFDAALDEAAPPESERAQMRTEADVLTSVGEMFADRVADLDRLIGDALARPDAFSPFVAGAAGNIATYAAIQRFDFDAARRWQQWATPYHEATGPFPKVYGCCFGGMAAREQLDLPAAEEMFRTALDTARATMGNTSHAARLASALLGDLRYETGDLEEAAELLEESRGLATEGGGGVDFMMATYATGARVRALLGDQDTARGLLDEGMAHAERLALPRLAARVRNERVRLGFELEHGEPEAILRRRAPQRRDGIATFIDECDEDSAIRLLLADANAERRSEAVERARTLTSGIDAVSRPLAALRAGFLLGVALRLTGRSEEAEQTLAPLARHSARLGLSRLPVDSAAGTAPRPTG
ncbi:serine/threonine-protein kinase [Nocardia beijingensis]|uniref:serine/threonine-protein kinase n=1 Tax=Nocardia beijingensis TaxID=95162 RepID=UPI00083315D8|nr:serine/threonine-protein kinase [Nocardia beijingensis]